MSTTRIPRQSGEFSLYINNTTSHLLTTVCTPVPSMAGDYSDLEPLPVANWRRLGLKPTEIAQWSSYFDQWNEIYPQYNQRKGTRITSIIDQLMMVQNSFIAFAQSLLSRIELNPRATAKDFKIFNIQYESILSYHLHTSNEKEMKFLLTPLGRARVKFTCVSIEDNRPTYEKNTDAVEVRYLVGDEAPNNADECSANLISTKAIFNLNLPAFNKGQYIYAFCRWVALIDPNLNGPYSKMQSTAIA